VSPSPANRSAHSRPIPDDAPVTRTIRDPGDAATMLATYPGPVG
jgi:hypothetical protein